MNIFEQYAHLCHPQAALPPLTQSAATSAATSFNLQLSNILFPSGTQSNPSNMNTITTSATQIPTTNTVAAAPLFRNLDFSSSLQQTATTTPQTTPPNNGGISNQFICSQLELLQQIELSKQQFQQQQQQQQQLDAQKDQYRIALINELLKLEQQQQQSQSSLSHQQQQQQQQYQTVPQQLQQQQQQQINPAAVRGSQVLSNPQIFESIVPSYYSNSQFGQSTSCLNTNSAAAASKLINPASLFSSLLPAINSQNPTFDVMTTEVLPASLSASAPAATTLTQHLQQTPSQQVFPSFQMQQQFNLQLPNLQQQQAQTQLQFPQSLTQLLVDSQNLLSQVTSKASSPFSNIDSSKEEEKTTQLNDVAVVTSNKSKISSSKQQQSQQNPQKSDEVLGEYSNNTTANVVLKPSEMRFPREFVDCDEGSVERIRADRLIKIETFRNKRRSWLKKISYDCRKKVADSRLRVKGRFISKKDTQKINLLVGESAEHAFNEKRNLRLDFMSDQMRVSNIEIQQAVSKNEILNQIEKVIQRNKQIHEQHMIQSVIHRIQKKQSIFSFFKRDSLPLRLPSCTALSLKHESSEDNLDIESS